MGVLGEPLGHFWESLRVHWGHLGSACGALAVLKIIEKQVCFIVFPAMEDPWATLERLWFVLWVVWCSLEVIGHSSGVLGYSRGVPWGSLRALVVALGILGGPLEGPKLL